MLCDGAQTTRYLLERNIHVPSANRFNFTQTKVEGLPTPTDGYVNYWDESLAGFGVRVSNQGVKTYFVQYRVRQPNGKLKERQETIGRASFLTVREARNRAIASKAKASSGVDPVGERREKEAEAKAEQADKEFTLAKLVDRYMTEHANKKTRASTAETTKGLLKRWTNKLGTRPASSIKKADVLAFLNDYRASRQGEGAAQSNHYLRKLAHVYTWAENKGLVEANPTKGVASEKLDNDRDRYLTDAEIVALWQACDKVGWPSGPIFKLLLLTGQRAAEIGAMRWNEIDETNRVLNLPASRVKNKKAHIVHLNDLAMEIIGKLPRINGSKFVFTTNGTAPFCNYDYSKKRLQKLMGDVPGSEDLIPWTPHDLRRTAVSKMVEIGIAPHVADRVLNHVSGTIRGVARIYIRYEFLPERKAALDKLGDHIAQLTGANVVKLRQPA
jgi:integrase